ncbi:MAG: L-threonylcarbamoyladenylate synthase [Hyphomicrobiales bacterium]
MDAPRNLQTRVLSVDRAQPDAGVIARAAEVLRGGGLVAFPTETVYGLGANAFNDAAVRRIFAAKERAANDPLIVHLATGGDLGRVARHVPPIAATLAARFWPGGLTLVLPKQPTVPGSATAGLDTVAVRVPAHPVAHALIAAAGVPVAAPSANRFTRTSATTAAHVLADLGGRIELVLDGGPADVGLESTVVAVREDGLTVLRPGAVPVEALEAALREQHPGAAVQLARRGDPVVAPGMLDKHYAPRARLVYVRGPREAAVALLAARLRQAADGGRVGVLLFDADRPALDIPAEAVTFALGDEAALDEVAHRLSAGLRALDEAGAEVIFARQPAGGGLAAAIDDRLRRAATEIAGVE